MKEFELCFALESQPPQFLIAGLLPKEQPDETELEKETLEFQYHYKVLPESIISRFIVITHNPVTMSRMDRLFGVTMREKGVSKLVSVDLDTAEELVAAE